MKAHSKPLLIVGVLSVIFVLLGACAWWQMRPHHAPTPTVSTAPSVSSTPKVSPSALALTEQEALADAEPSPSWSAPDGLVAVPKSTLTPQEEPELSQAQLEELVDRPARRTADMFLKNFYTAITTANSWPHRESLIAKISTRSLLVYYANVQEARDWGIDERAWRIKNITYTDVKITRERIDSFTAHAHITLKLREDETTTRTVEGLIRVEADPQGWSVSQWGKA